MKDIERIKKLELVAKLLIKASHEYGEVMYETLHTATEIAEDYFENED